jgi:DHA3 family macrolide efflux protein-like MFS transporter
MLLLMGMAAIINFLLNPAFSLSPLLVNKHFGGGVVEVGWFESSFGVGVVVGGLLLSVWGGFKRRIITSMVGVIGMGAGIALVGSLPSNAYVLAIAGMTFAGLMNPICNGAIFAIMQAKVAPEMQGRVLSLMGSVSMAMAPLSMLIAGPVSDKIGIQAWYLAGGITCIVLGVVAYFVHPIHYVEDHVDGNILPAHETLAAT